MSEICVTGLGKELECLICHTIFLRRVEEWGYRFANGTCVCSWHCLRDAEALGIKLQSSRSRRPGRKRELTTV